MVTLPALMKSQLRNQVKNTLKKCLKKTTMRRFILPVPLVYRPWALRWPIGSKRIPS